MTSWLGKFSRLTANPIAVVVLACCLRVVAVAIWSDDLSADTDAYLGLAKGLAQGDGFINAKTGEPTAFRPPLYPILIAMLFSVGGGNWAIGFLQVGLGTATVFLTWHLAGRIGLSPSRSTIAAALVAVDPILVRYTAHAMTETLVVFLVTLLLLAWSKADGESSDRSKRWHWGSGVILGLCALCRPTIWGFIGLVALDWGRRRFSAPPCPALPWRLILVAALVVLPWGIRNWIQFGRPIITTTHGGYTLLLGNNSTFYREVVHAPLGTTWSGGSLAAWQESLESEMEAQNVRGEISRDAWHSRRVRENIKAAPTDFLLACVLRIGRLWGIAPNNAASLQRQLIGIFYTALLITSFVRLVQALPSFFALNEQSRRLILIIFATSLVHTIYWSNMRMRAPLMPVVAIIAVAGLAKTNNLSGCASDG